MELNAFDCYTVLKDENGAPVILGHGPWGSVYKAFNSDLRCYAALRVIAQGAFESDEVRERFVREVRLAAHIRHPSLASVFPLKFIGDRYLYATEYAEGETLTSRIAHDGRLDMLLALRIVSQIAAGLDLASAANLLHRNIAADNVMLVRDDEEISVKVLGLALPPARVKENHANRPCEFSSPEESAGTGVDVRSGVYSLGAILYYILVGAEKYGLFRAKSLASAEVLLEDAVDFPSGVSAILKNALCHNPVQRMATFTELRKAIDDLLKESGRTKSDRVVRSARASALEDAVAARVALPGVALPKSAAAEKSVSPSAKSRNVATAKVGVTIPARLLGSAQPGAVLVLSRRGATNEHLVVCSRDQFRIGRSTSAGADLAVGFLPRNSTNDAKTKRLSRIHVTARYEDGQIVLVDGDGVTPSVNGSTFDGRNLSIETPLSLVKSGDLRLAGVFSIRVVSRTFEHRDAPSIANLRDWKGPAHERGPLLAGAIVFVPAELNKTRVAVWLFSVAPFGSSRTSPLDFALPAGSREIGVLHYYRGCFWIEAKSAHAIFLDRLALAPAEIGPLVTGQVIEIGGTKYSVKIDDVSDVR